MSNRSTSSKKKSKTEMNEYGKINVFQIAQYEKKIQDLIMNNNTLTNALSTSTSTINQQSTVISNLEKKLSSQQVLDQKIRAMGTAVKQLNHLWDEVQELFNVQKECSQTNTNSSFLTDHRMSCTDISNSLNQFPSNQETHQNSRAPCMTLSHYRFSSVSSSEEEYVEDAEDTDLSKTRTTENPLIYKMTLNSEPPSKAMPLAKKKNSESANQRLKRKTTDEKRSRNKKLSTSPPSHCRKKILKVKLPIPVKRNNKTTSASFSQQQPLMMVHTQPKSLDANHAQRKISPKTSTTKHKRRSSIKKVTKTMEHREVVETLYQDNELAKEESVNPNQCLNGLRVISDGWRGDSEKEVFDMSSNDSFSLSTVCPADKIIVNDQPFVVLEDFMRAPNGSAYLEFAKHALKRESAKESDSMVDSVSNHTPENKDEEEIDDDFPMIGPIPEFIIDSNDSNTDGDNDQDEIVLNGIGVSRTVFRKDFLPYKKVSTQRKSDSDSSCSTSAVETVLNSIF